MRVDALEEGRRVDARLKAIDAPSSSTRDFILTLLHDRVKQVQSFVERCHQGLDMVQRTMFPLNPAPSTLGGLLDWYRNPKDVREYVHEQLINGAIVALAFVRVHCPRLDIAKICRGLPSSYGEDPTSNMQPHFDVVRRSAENVIHQMEWEEDQVLQARGEIPPE